MGTTTTRTPRADWSLRPRGAAGAAVQGALALAALATVGDAVNLETIWGGAFTVAGALGTVVVSARQDLAPAGLLYRLGCWIGAGSWLTYALAATPWNLNTFAALGIGALTAGLLAPLARPRSRTETAGGGTALVLRQGGRIGAEWEARILRVCRVRVVVTQVRTWPNGTGYDVHADLPGGGVTRGQVAGYAEGLATDARLPEGCGVEVAAGEHRGAVVLRVSTVNRLAQVVDYPPDYSPQSVLEAIEFGEHANSDPCGAEVREEATLIAGKRGSGKTTLLQAVSIALGRCADNIVWHLDLNGGGLTQPWIDVWLDGRVARCPIDWAAPNLVEGKFMLEAAISIAKHRKASYRQLKRAHNTNLLPVSADLPQITIVVDEGAQAVKDRDLQAMLSELQNIGRNEAVNLILSALRPTSDLVPVNMRKQAGVRIQMHGPDNEELGHMFGWKAGVSMDQLAGKGTGFISFDGSPPRPFRGFQVLPAQIEQAAVSIAAMRPDLDAASAAAAGPHYAMRLNRMRQAFTNPDAELDELPVPAPAVAPRRLAAVPDGAGSWPDPHELIHRHAGSLGWPDPHRIEHVAQQQSGPTLHTVRPAAGIPAVSARPIPEVLLRALAAFDTAGTARLHSEELAAALSILDAEGKPNPTALADLLRPLGVTPLSNPFLRAGERGRGYARDDLSAAAERVQSGELAVPEQVTAWPAA
ncbi:hypothetical protein [Sinosporangium siamense]|uniref:FtsK domain-containing protein n=1 Tax=Sinosporangium siamense TaxID=1367973 RepID=A0A919RC33_9ACTN|nr:hypothetical protein [Sinosporangium siamense]GII91153.1 hypothetical protein Ssi02_13840 [Sinosporangium siamense]